MGQVFLRWKSENSKISEVQIWHMSDIRDKTYCHSATSALKHLSFNHVHLTLIKGDQSLNLSGQYFTH